jgi:hypothetical protein
MNKKTDRRYGSKSGVTLLAERTRARAERVRRAIEYRSALSAEVVAVGGSPASASTMALLDSATSAYMEIARTTERFIYGSAHDKAMQRLQFCRSELRRALRALRLITDDAESRADNTMADVVARFGGD